MPTHTPPPPQANNPLHGITLACMLTELQAHYDWGGLYSHINIRCFNHEPSIQSSLKFLRKTPWAREKVEALYCRLIQRRTAKSSISVTHKA